MNAVERLRMDKGLTQREVARRAGVSRLTVIRAEAGAMPTGPTAKRLAGVFDMTGSELVDLLRREADGREAA